MKKILFFGLCFFILSSCEKVVEIDLNNVASQVFIEGQVTDILGNYQVQINKTVNFSAANQFPAVQNAIVTITDNTGVTETLTEKSAGLYVSRMVKGISGRTYTLKVVAEGKTYSASSTMPQAVDFTSAEVKESPLPAGGATKFYNYLVFFQDPAGIQNQYRFTLTSKGQKDKGFSNVFNDNLIDGKPNPIPLRSTDFKIASKDTVTIEMQCIDKAVYEYFYTFRALETGQGGTPANPINNITGGALGYFSAHTVRKVDAIVP